MDIARVRADLELVHDQLPPNLEKARESLNQAIADLHAGDHGAHFEDDVIEAARVIRDESEGEFSRYRGRLKAAGKGNARIGDWTNAVKGKGEPSGREDTIADELIKLAIADCELFHDPDRKPFATIRIGDHSENWRIDSTGFSEWLASTYYRTNERAASENAIRTALNSLSGKARFDGEEIPVYLRCAVTAEGYVIDLGNERWQAIHITATGWKVVDTPPVRFWRTDNTRPLPAPDSPGNLDALWDFCNVQQIDRPLLLAWIIECWRPDTPFPVLELIGEQGSAKSTTHDHLRQLIDPNKTNLRGAPRQVEDIQIAGVNSWLVSFNNLSRITPDQQDAMCCLATGGGMARRTLYTDADEHAIDIKRPVAMNGIAPLATAADLVDRVIRLRVPRINGYREESEIQAEFEAEKPSIFAGLLDLFSAALAGLFHAKAESDIRMTDFSRLGASIANHLDTGPFNDLYRQKRRDTVLSLIDSSPAACALIRFMESRANQPIACQNIEQLLDKLNTFRDDHDTSAWPKSARGLKEIFLRLSPALRQAGYEVRFEDQRTKQGFPVSVEYLSRTAQ